MPIEKYKTEVLRPLQRKLPAPRDGEAIWSAVKALAEAHAGDRFQIDTFIYALALTYAERTGNMPGYTNSDNETLFERFAGAVTACISPRTTRQQLRNAIRKLDAKRNVQFLCDLKTLTESRCPAAE